MSSLKTLAALGTAATIAAVAMVPTVAPAAPIGARAAQLNQSIPTTTVDVRWRRRDAFALGAAAGIFTGAAIAAGAYSYPYYHKPYPYAYYYDDPPIAYYDPGPRRCLVRDPYTWQKYWAVC